MLGIIRNSQGFRPKLAIALLAGVATIALCVDSADARGRRHHRASGGGYNPPYAAIVVDANTGSVLHASEPDGVRHPASLTKIMTLYLLFERMEAGRIKPDTPFRVSAHAASQSPTKLGLRAGDTITAEEAIKGLVTRSANDAAVVIAEALAGDEDSFAKLMTRKARSLGMNRTVYMNASGLPNSDQVTSARDQAILGRAIQDRFPNHYRYFAISSFKFRGQTIGNHNRLLGSVKGVDGIKTGYVRASGFNLVSSMRRNNRHLVAVVLGGASAGARDARMRSLLEKYVEDASTRRTAPAMAEIREIDVPVAIRSAEAPAAPVDTARTRKTTEAAAPAKPKPATVTARTADPIKPIQVKTIKVKLGGVQTVALTPALAHLPVVTIEEKSAKVAAPLAKVAPAQAAAPAPVVPASKPAPVVQAAVQPATTIAVATPVAQAPVAAKVAAASPPASQPARSTEPPELAPAMIADDETDTPVVAALKPEPVKVEPTKVEVAKVEPTRVAPTKVETVKAAPITIPVATSATVREQPRQIVIASASPDDTDATFALAAPKTEAAPTAERAVAAVAKAETAAPAKQPAHTGWIIQIGAYEGEREAKEKLSSAKAKAKQVLGNADPFTEAVVKDNKTFYRARFAGFEKDSAEAACRYLKRNDFGCLTIRN